METVTISLNGREVAGPPDTTILDLAGQVGVKIPTLCHHPVLKSAGACRVCLVEDAKTGRLLASCVTPITQGMEIVTDSPSVFRARRGVLELILSDHPSACVVCSKGNECVLRALAKDHGICDPELDPIRRWRPVEEVNPFIVRDLTKCVLCGRCIRVCKDYEAVGAIEYMDRGYGSHPGTANRTPLEGSECNFCGSCVSICPTDALAERNRIFIGSGKAYVPGICSYCGTGCHLEYALANGAVVGARGVLTSPVNSLSLCVRGHYGQDALCSPERLTDPLVRAGDGTLGKPSWDEALEDVAGRLKEIIQRYGPSSVGVIAGMQCSNEELYLAGRFARAIIGTPHVDSTARFSSGPVVEALAESLKGIHTGASLARILEAQTIVLVGARPDYTHPVIARNLRQAVRKNGAALIQFDPLTTMLSRYTQIRFKNGLDEMPRLVTYLMKELVAEGLHDNNFLINNVMDHQGFVSCFMPQPKDKPPSKQVKEAVRLIGAGRKLAFLFGPMVGRATNGYILTRLVTDLALLCGQPESLFFLFEGCNELGAWEMGCAPDRLPGGLALDNGENLETLKRVWNAPIALQRGMDAMGMIRSAEGGSLKALVLLGVDPIAVFPDTDRTRRALSKLDLVVRTGMFPSRDVEIAHFVFPAVAITETDGTYVSAEGRVQRVSRITDPPGNARPTARFLLDLVGRLGPAMGFLTAKDIFDEIRSVCPGWNGLTWSDVGQPGGMLLGSIVERPPSSDRHKEGSLLVPYPPPDLFREPPAGPAGLPWKVFAEERAVHPGDGVLSGRSFRLSRFENWNCARMHPEDAAKLGARQGSVVVLRSEVGEAKARVALDPEVPRSGVVIPAGGPGYMLQSLLAWPEEYCPPGWDRIFASVALVEE